MEKKDWKERLSKILEDNMIGFCSQIGGAEHIQIEELIEQELDRAREEGYKKGRDKIDKSTPEEGVEESVWDMLEREEDGYIKEISNYWQKNGHKHIEIEIVPNEPDEPEKVYVDPIVPNFTEELSWPVEYKTRKQVKEMFKDTPEQKEEWKKKWEEFFLYVTNDKNWVDGRPEWKGNVYITLYNAMKDFIKDLLLEREREVLNSMREWVVEYHKNNWDIRDFDAEIAIGKIIDRELSKLNKKK